MKIKRNKGFVSTLVLSGIILVFGLVAGWVALGYHQAGTSFDQVDGSRSYQSANLQVYAITPQAILQVDNGKSQIYVVNYQYDESDTSKVKFAGIEVAPNDSTVKEIMAAQEAGTLATNPVTIKGKKITIERTDRPRNTQIQNYSSIKDAFDPTSLVYQNLDTQSYLSVVDYSWDILLLSGATVVLVVFAIALIFLAFAHKKRVVKAYDEIFTSYPELQGDLDNLVANATYHDEQIKALIYKNHLVTYQKGFFAQDLTQTTQLYQYVQTIYNSGAKNVNTWLVAKGPQIKKEYRLTLKKYKKETDERVNLLLTAIGNHFPDIHLGV